MRWWEQQIGGETRGRIIALLRRGVQTVEELAAELRVTDNAVRAQIQSLESAGLVIASGTRRGRGAGKPATVYRVAPTAEPLLSAAYAPVLTALLGVMSERIAPEVVDNIMREAGRRLAPMASHADEPLEARVRRAAAFLTVLGAELDVESTTDGFKIRGYACPLSAIVSTNPRACQVVQELLTTLVGESVQECCDRVDGARCGFSVLERSA